MSRSYVFQLARRHEVLHAGPKVLAICALAGTGLINLLVFRSLSAGTAVAPGRFGLFLVEAVLLSGVAVLLLRDLAARRCRSWEASLPLSSGELWRSHTLALTMAGFLSIAVTGAVMIGFVALMRPAVDQLLLTNSQLALMFVRPLLLTFTAAGVVSLRRPELVDLDDDPQWAKLRILTVVGMFAVLLLLQFTRPVQAVVPAMLVLIALYRTGRRLPTVLESWPTGVSAAAGRARTGARDEAFASSHGSVSRRVVMRQLFKWPMNWIVMPPFVLGGGLLLSGYLPMHAQGGFDDESMRVMHYWLVIYMLLAVLGHFLENLWRVDHLPISRRRLLLWAVLPNLIALLVGYGVGVGVSGYQRANHDEISLQEFKTRLWLDVPIEYLDLTWGSEAPTLTAATGEPVQIHSQRVLPGLPLTAHNTFFLTEDSTAPEVAWQIARAVEMVYGQTIDWREIQARYLTIDAQGRPHPVEGGLTLRADYPDLAPSYRGPVLPLLIGSLVTIFLLVVGAVFSGLGRGATIRRARFVFWCTMALLLAIHIGGFGMLIGRWMRDWALTAAVLVTARRIAELGPVAIGLTWAGAVVAVAGAWRLAEGRFRAAEAPRSR